MRHYVRRDRFNGCYNESKEVQIEWLEALLSKLGSIEKGTYPMFGYLGHVGRLIKEYVEERSPHQGTLSILVYPEFMEFFVGEGFLVEQIGGEA
jgi:hypothetical protein